jgi:ubiquinone/menaquinone biosynthesis C-methylase UbiE
MIRPIRIDPDRFEDFTYARRSHWTLFEGYEKELYGRKQNIDKVNLKVYQDLLVFAFIRDHISAGSRILDVGGGDSRILEYFASTYDCWNIDKLEGVGNGPKIMREVPYRLVHDYMGSFNTELPDNYFDFVFSISALEHVQPQKNEVFDPILADIDRVLKPGAFSLHLFDILFKPNGCFWTNTIVHRIFEKKDTLNTFVSQETVRDDPDLFFLNKRVFDKYWKKIVGKSYDEMGRPSSLNILWRKQGNRETELR